jgi:hypothetical protein
MSDNRALQATNVNLRRENATLRATVAELEAQLAEARRTGKPEPDFKVAPTEEPKYDARNPIKPGKDPYWDHVMSSRNRRRTWLDS